MLQITRWKSLECTSRVLVTENTMENDFYRIVFNEEGEICLLYDKKADRMVSCEKPMNHFGVFEDKPQRYDAWDIDIYYQEKTFKLFL